MLKNAEPVGHAIRTLHATWGSDSFHKFTDPTPHAVTRTLASGHGLYDRSGVPLLASVDINRLRDADMFVETVCGPRVRDLKKYGKHLARENRRFNASLESELRTLRDVTVAMAHYTPPPQPKTVWDVMMAHREDHTGRLIDRVDKSFSNAIYLIISLLRQPDIYKSYRKMIEIGSLADVLEELSAGTGAVPENARGLLSDLYDNVAAAEASMDTPRTHTLCQHLRRFLMSQDWRVAVLKGMASSNQEARERVANMLLAKEGLFTVMGKSGF